jgi:hypothetical protein
MRFKNPCSARSAGLVFAVTLFAPLGLCANFGADAPLAWPTVTHETKPWTRWWWLGNISTEEDLRSEMKKYADAGLGGLEITPIYGVRGYETQFIPFLSPTFVDRFEFVNREAKRLGMGVDMSTGTGWPFGGPWVEPRHSAKYLAHRTFTVAAGHSLGAKIEMLEKPVLRFAGPTRVPLAEIKDPVTANTNLQELAIDQVRFPKPLPLHTLMAYPSSGGTPVDLTSKVREDGTLEWTAPADRGAWTLYALFTGWHGKQVERSGPGGEGDALDHFSRKALEEYLKKFDQTLAGRDPGGFRAWFNDSYEVDDAQGESNFTPEFFEQFKPRRGYDLREQLPALMDGFAAAPAPGDRVRRGVPLDSQPPPSSGQPITDAQARVLSDYRETISDLLLEEFTQPWAKWAARNGAIIRNQAHGSPANILDLYAASDIPEQEGDSPIRLKFASSAAHLTGKRLAASETATWLGEHFSSTLADLKARVDLTFLGGINHIVYHGTAYSPPGDAWPGFHFYASVELNPTNPIWEHFGALNQYVTRIQSFLQAGQPAESVLLYYPIHDRWAGGGGAMPHFGGPQGTAAQGVAQTLWEKGYTFDYVSDRLLSGARIADGRVSLGGGNYDVVLVPETKLMPLATLEKLLALADEGATVIFQKALPADVPGFGNLDQRRTAFRALIAKLTPARTGSAPSGLEATPVGRGKVLVGADPAAALAEAKLAPEPFPSLGLQFVRRRQESGLAYFVLNQSEKPVRTTVRFSGGSESAAMFDPMTGVFGLVGGGGTDGGYNVSLDLAPGASCIVMTSTRKLTGPTFPFHKTRGDPQTLEGTWRVEFVRGGPHLPAATETTVLKSWTEFGGEELKAFSGTARYTLDFTRPTEVAGGWLLDLGRVAESARVTMNGVDLGTVISAPFRVHVPAGLIRERNTLHVEVANLAANRIADLDRRGMPWKKFYNANMPARIRENAGADGMFSAARWTPRVSGLLGPVTLTPLE